MKRLSLLAMSLLICGTTAAPQTPGAAGGSQGDQSLSPQDVKWLSYAAHDNQGEIQICLLAEKKAQSLAVKAFARLMVDDHVQIESQLASVASGKPELLPNGPGEDAQKTLSKLQPLQGTDFDREFIQAQIKDHGDDLKKYQDELDSTKDTNIRRYAALTRPILQQHLQLAKAVQAQL